MIRPVSLAALCLALLAGCRDEPPARPDAAPPPPPDAAIPDAAIPDAAVDAAPLDASTDAQVVLGQVTMIKLDAPKPATPKPATAPRAAPPAAATGRQVSIMGTIERHQGEVVDCYAAVAENKPDVAGQLTVQWTLGADGTPTGASIARDTLGDPAVGACVKAKAVKWKFPPPDGGLGVVKYTWNLKLQ